MQNSLRDILKSDRVKVSAVEPSSGEKVWLRKGKNLEEYVEPAIYVKNSIGDYEEFIKKEETIVNANGTAIKFPDGTMICRNTMTFESVNINNVWGAMYDNATILNLGNFPVAFISKPTVTANVIKPGANGVIENIEATTETKVGGCYVMRPTTTTNVQISINYIAVGRWK